MKERQSERNASIIALRKSGKSYALLAREFNVSIHRVRQIVELAARREEKRCAALIAKYGERPNIGALADDTPIEVLELCEDDMHGWAARISHLKYSHENPLATLGDVRRTTDAQLRKEPNVGRKMIAKLRRFCPFRDTASDAGEALRHLRRALLAIGKLETELSAARPYVSSFFEMPSLDEARDELQHAIALIEGMRR